MATTNYDDLTEEQVRELMAKRYEELAQLKDEQARQQGVEAAERLKGRFAWIPGPKKLPSIGMMMMPMVMLYGMKDQMTQEQMYGIAAFFCVALCALPAFSFRLSAEEPCGLGTQR